MTPGQFKAVIDAVTPEQREALFGCFRRILRGICTLDESVTKYAMKGADDAEHFANR